MHINTHFNGTVSLTFTKNHNVKYKTQKQTKPIIARTRHYEGRSVSSRTVLLSKHTVTGENQNYYEVVLPLLYITYHNFICDVTLWRHYY